MTRRSRSIALLAASAALAMPATAGAAVERLHRFEAVATANYTVVEQCAGGATAQQLVTVIGGHEQESVNGASTLDNEFLTVLLRGVNCDGELVNDRGFGTGQFTFKRSLKRARVVGTLTTSGGRTVTADVAWEGTGEVDKTTNVTRFPGFVGHFKGKRRDAVATGTVVVDGATLVNGSTSNAELETLEDRNRTRT